MNKLVNADHVATNSGMIAVPGWRNAHRATRNTGVRASLDEQLDDQFEEVVLVRECRQGRRIDLNFSYVTEWIFFEHRQNRRPSIMQHQNFDKVARLWASINVGGTLPKGI